MSESSEATLRRQAAETVRRLSNQELPKEADPILELISLLLTDEAGELLPGSLSPAEQWLAWNQLALEREEDLGRELTRLLKQEEMELPTETETLRLWAAETLLGTLDRLET